MDICSYALMDIEVRNRQFENITTTDTQAQLKCENILTLFVPGITDFTDFSYMSKVKLLFCFFNFLQILKIGF